MSFDEVRKIIRDGTGLAMDEEAGGSGEREPLPSCGSHSVLGSTGGVSDLRPLATAVVSDTPGTANTRHEAKSASFSGTSDGSLWSLDSEPPIRIGPVMEDQGQAMQAKGATEPGEQLCFDGFIEVGTLELEPELAQPDLSPPPSPSPPLSPHMPRRPVAAVEAFPTPAAPAGAPAWAQAPAPWGVADGPRRPAEVPPLPPLADLARTDDGAVDPPPELGVADDSLNPAKVPSVPSIAASKHPGAPAVPAAAVEDPLRPAEAAVADPPAALLVAQ